MSNDERSGFRRRIPMLCETVGAMTSSSRPSRRGFLVGAGLAVLGAGGGVVAGLLVDRSSDETEVPNPAVLLAAAKAERDLLDAVSDVGPRNEPLRSLLDQIRADHEAHLAALLAEVAVATGSGTLTGFRPLPFGVGLERDGLRRRESAAAATAAKRALSLTGRDAALLASISACEASHAELLS